MVAILIIEPHATGDGPFLVIDYEWMDVWMTLATVSWYSLISNIGITMARSLSALVFHAVYSESVK